MTSQHELYRKTEEVIGKFKNGRDRYRTSATFNRTVQMLARGADPYEVIDQLTQVTEDTMKAHEQYVIRHNQLYPVSA